MDVLTISVVVGRCRGSMDCVFVGEGLASAVFLGSCLEGRVAGEGIVGGVCGVAHAGR